jgi:hypothetical protein
MMLYRYHFVVKVLGRWEGFNHEGPKVHEGRPAASLQRALRESPDERQELLTAKFAKPREGREEELLTAKLRFTTEVKGIHHRGR